MIFMTEWLTIQEAANYAHVTEQTLRNWEKRNAIKPGRTTGNHRRYTKEMIDEALEGIKKVPTNNKITIGYCRVSSNHQKDDLQRQIKVVQTYCEQNGYVFKILTDIGSGLNYQRPNFKELIHLICTRQCDRLIVNYQDRLARFGFDLIKTICNENDVELVIINQTQPDDPNQELVQDVLSIITVFSAKLYGKRSHYNAKVIKENKELFKQNR